MIMELLDIICDDDETSASVADTNRLHSLEKINSKSNWINYIELLL
jgi:hypothetical protein